MGIYEDMEETRKQLAAAAREVADTNKKLKQAIIDAFWFQSGYSRHSTQNSAIIEQAIRYTVDMLHKR